MSLKLLVIPFSILLILILVIGFVKPDIGLLQEKQATYATKLDQAKNIDTLLGNIDALSALLKSESEADHFVRNYFPQEMDQGRVIDILNFLASKSGVAVDTMHFEEPGSGPIAASAEVALEETVSAGVPLAGILSRVATPKTFSTEIIVKGRYENIKNFFQRVAHMNRAHKTRYFSIKTAEKRGDSKDDDTEILAGSFRADFDFMEAAKKQNALYAATFTKGTFAMTSYTIISDWVTENIPLLEKPVSGRPNPFQ